MQHRETDLYAPVKAFLERQGYEVKGEVGAADVVACRDGDPPVIVELKTSFSLSLLRQGVARLSVTDAVYVCVPRKAGRAAWLALRENVKLCRRLGLGVITVRLSDGHLEVMCDPGPYAPRKSRKRQGRLLREFARRAGDPSPGGATRDGLVTAYRQDALRLAGYLAEHGETKGAVVAKATGVAQATRIMREDHYGWFRRVATGVYGLTSGGAEGLSYYGRGETPVTCPKTAPRARISPTPAAGSP